MKKSATYVPSFSQNRRFPTMNSLFLFERRQMIAFLLLLGVMIEALGEYHNPASSQNPASNEENIESELEETKDSYLSPNTNGNISTAPISFGVLLHSLTSKSPRPARSIKVKRAPSSICNMVNYFSNSQPGRRSLCPFDWVVNYETRRIPERIVEQVCLSCGSCGPNRQCAQIKTPFQVYFRDTKEFSQQIVRSGCACMMSEVGATADIFSFN